MYASANPVNTSDPLALQPYDAYTAYHLLQHGYQIPRINVPLVRYYRKTIETAKPVLRAVKRWDKTFGGYFFQYHAIHREAYCEYQQSIDTWYLENMIQVLVLLEATKNWPQAAGETLGYSIAWASGSVANQVNLASWYLIDVNHASFSTLLKETAQRR
jgi:hypothetical protein